MSSDLPTGWVWQPLESLCERVSVGHVGETSQFFTEHGGVPLIRSQNVKPSKVELADVKYITKEFHEKSRKSQLRGGDLLVVRVGQNRGDCAVLRENLGDVNCANIVFARPDNRYSEFLGAYFNTSRGREALLAVSSGSAQLVLNTKAVAKIAVPVPTPGEAQALGAISRAFDDRITLLRETNATLEAIAQALFKSWFVDFDPVRAKAEGRQPEGMDATTAALFPDSFEESELGLVPSGWAVGVLGDIASIKGGKQLEKEFFDDRGLNPIFGGAGVMGHTGLKNAQGFVITVGRVGAYCGQFFWHLGEAWVNNNASHIQPMRNLDAVWIYQWLRATNIDHIKKGAAQPFVSNGDLAELKLALPTGELVDRFVEVVGPVYEQMASLQAQAKTLTQLRDTLLPRLISGQLRLPEAEQCVEEALA